MQVSTHNQDTPAANKQHKIEDQLPEYFNHGRILAPLAGIIPDLSFNLVGHHRDTSTSEIPTQKRLEIPLPGSRCSHTTFFF